MRIELIENLLVEAGERVSVGAGGGGGGERGLSAEEPPGERDGVGIWEGGVAREWGASRGV